MFLLLAVLKCMLNGQKIYKDYRNEVHLYNNSLNSVFITIFVQVK